MRHDRHADAIPERDKGNKVSASTTVVTPRAMARPDGKTYDLEMTTKITGMRVGFRAKRRQRREFRR